MNFHRLVFAISCLCLWSADQTPAQEAATQDFEVEVPVILSINAPTESVTILHDETDNQQVFPAQTWQLSGNPESGMAVSFQIQSGFVHTESSSSKADAKLRLFIASDSGGEFGPTDSYDTTNLSAGISEAVVTASSNGPGDAEIDLTVTFLTGTFVNLRAGVYSLTVVGTISAN